MARTFLKAVAATNKMNVLKQVYDHYIVGDKNWQIVWESGTWSGTPANGDRVVLRVNQQWAEGVAGQYFEVLLTANDSTSAISFGGAGGSKYTIPGRSYCMVVSPDGGWTAATEEFVSPSSLPEQLLSFTNGATESVNTLSLVDSPEMFAFWTYSNASTYYIVAIAGKCRRIDSVADTPRPSVGVVGRLAFAATTGYIGQAGVAKVPNVARNGWSNSYIDEPTTRYDTHAFSRDGGKILERPCIVWDASSPGGQYGELIDVNRCGIAAGTGVVTDNQRICIAGLSFPWE